MRICIFGAGSVGGYLGGMLAKAGVDTSLIARGEHLEAIRRKGLTLSIGENDPFTLPIPASDNPADFAAPDLLILTVKSHSLPRCVESLTPLIGEHTTVLTIVNGIPWWYCHQIGNDAMNGTLDGKQLETVDPGGVVWRTIGPEKALGCVTNVASEVKAPGHVHMHTESWFRIGEPTHQPSDRLTAVCHAFQQAGIDAQPRDHIRSDVWHKLWGNACYNPLSVLTGGTLEQLSTDTDMKAIITHLMKEIRTVAESVGIDSLKNIESRIEIARKLGAHKTSMLQDWEQGREMEIGTIIGAIGELGDMAGLSLPMCHMLYACVKMKQELRSQ